MFVQLNQDELVEAVTEYLRSSQGIPLENRQVEIRFVANRKPPSTSAEVEITSPTEQPAPAVGSTPFGFGSNDED
jgi:hypothetical protein